MSAGQAAPTFGVTIYEHKLLYLKKTGTVAYKAKSEGVLHEHVVSSRTMLSNS